MLLLLWTFLFCGSVPDKKPLKEERLILAPGPGDTVCQGIHGGGLWHEEYKVHLSVPGSREEIEAGHNTNCSHPVAHFIQRGLTTSLNLVISWGPSLQTQELVGDILNVEHSRYVSEGHKHYEQK